MKLTDVLKRRRSLSQVSLWLCHRVLYWAQKNRLWISLVSVEVCMGTECQLCLMSYSWHAQPPVRDFNLLSVISKKKEVKKEASGVHGQIGFCYWKGWNINQMFLCRSVIAASIDIMAWNSDTKNTCIYNCLYNIYNLYIRYLYIHPTNFIESLLYQFNLLPSHPSRVTKIHSPCK